MKDPRFAETVILLVEYSRQGAVGLVINRTTGVRLSEVLPDIGKLKQRMDIVYFGGPVNTGQMFMLIRSVYKPEESIHIFKDIYASSSRKLLQKMIDNSAAGERFKIYAGYSGWAPQQLDMEVSRGDWHVLQADMASIFDKEPPEIWPELIRRVSAQWVMSTIRLSD
ncbi:MAG: YqgE/AlgH family protein [Nitrospirota bacterium]